MAKVCKKCGAELHEGDTFCRQCGTDNSEKAVAAPVPVQQASAPVVIESNVTDSIREHINQAKQNRSQNQNQNQKTHPLFGFRSGKTWKKIIAVVWYVVSAMFLIAAFAAEPQFECSTSDLILFKASCVVLLAPTILVPLLCSDFSIYQKLPGKNINKAIKSIILVIICFLLLSLIICSFSPEYKAASDAHQAQQEEVKKQEQAKQEQVKQSAEKSEASPDLKAPETTEEAESTESAPSESVEEEQASAVSDVEQVASEMSNPIPELAEALVSEGYTEEEAQAFCDVVVNCGLTKYVNGSTIEASNNGALTSVRIRKESSVGVLQINATAENHEVFYVEWNQKRYGLTKDHGDTVIMYDTDNVDDGYKNYYDEESDAFMAWELRPGA